MKRKASVLAASSLALSVAGCSQENADEKSPASFPFGTEMALAQEAPNPAIAPVTDISVEQTKALIAKGNIRLIDVRRDDEVTAGMIAGAEHIPLDRFDPAQLDLSDGREVVLYCRSGRRSTIAGQRLSAHLGKPVKHLQGGYLAWTNALLD